MPSCFVVGCKTGYGGQRGVHLFKVHKDATPEVRQMWIKNIPKRRDKRFDFKSSVICDKHFDDSLIVKKIVVNASLNLVVDRKIWTLTPDAVPTKFINLGLPSYLEGVPCSRNRKPARVRNTKKTGTQELERNASSSTEAIDPTPEGESAEEPEGQTCVLNSDSNRLSFILPLQWMASRFDTGMVYTKMILDSSSDPNKFLAEKKLVVNDSGVLQVFMRGSEVATEKLELSNFVASIDDVKRSIQVLNDVELCPGVKNMKMFHSFSNCLRWSDSWISDKCAIQSTKEKTCSACELLKSVMQATASTLVRRRRRPSCPPLLQTVDSKSGYYTAKMRLQRRLRHYKTRSKCLSKELMKIQTKLKTMTVTSLHEIIDKANYLEASMKLALKTAVSNQKAKSPTGRRYTSDWILQALLLRIRSPKAYRHLRDEGMLPLPNPGYLTQMLRGVKCQFGFNKFLLDQLAAEFKGKELRDRQAFLVFDEMKVKEGISFDRRDMCFTGFIDYENFLPVTSNQSGNKVADHALVFMVRGLNSKMTQPFACFATRGAAPGTVLSKMIVSAIVHLENSGIQIVGVVSDGATTNKTAWKTLGVGEPPFSNKIPNPADDNRYVHFLCDIPHIFKCIRNNLHKVKFGTFGNLRLQWGMYETLYNIDSKNVLRAAPKLTVQHVNPGPFQKMSVKLAVQVFSKTVSDALKFYRQTVLVPDLQDSSDTEEFTRVLNKLFDACNTSSLKDGIRPGSAGYVVIHEFLRSIQDSDSFATRQTITSLKVTLQSILDLVDYLCDVVGFDYVCTSKFNQDCLEKFFGLIRSFGGDESHPNITSFTHLFRLLAIHNPVSRILKGNVDQATNLQVARVSLFDLISSYRKENFVAESQRKTSLENAILDKIVNGNRNYKNDPASTSETSKYMVYHLAGFVAFKWKSITSCSSCANILCESSFEPQDASLTNIKDLGSLTRPSKPLYYLLLNTVEPVISRLQAEEIQSKVLMERVIENLEYFDCGNLGCSLEHSSKNSVQIIIYYITIRMYFYEKHYNKECLTSVVKSKQKFKEAKLK